MSITGGVGDGGGEVGAYGPRLGPWLPPVDSLSAPAAQAPGEPRRHVGLRVAVAALLVLVAVGAGVGIGRLAWPSSAQRSAGAGGPFFGQSPFGSGVPSVSPAGGAEGGGAPTDIAAIAAKVDPALVEINSTLSYQAAAGAGTGIVLTSSGEVLTNNHVIDGATRISVIDVGNGKPYSATAVGYDSTHDIAVIQLQGASGLQVAKFADSSQLAVDDPVVAIGNAGGAGGTPTSAGGSITALRQSVTASDSFDGTTERLTGLIEVNADVQPGDSGGPLVNSSGGVIGMDTAGSESFSFQSSASQGYAILSNEALSTAKAIEAGHLSGVVHVGETAFLGVLVDASGGAEGSSSSGLCSRVSSVEVRLQTRGLSPVMSSLRSTASRWIRPRP